MAKHTQKEDWIAILTGTLIVAQGIFFLQAAHLLTGGTAGLALLLSKVIPCSFGTLYFLANCPFYLLAWKRFGTKFAVNSAISGALVSVFADSLHLVIHIDMFNPIYCAFAGGLLMGLGMLILFRHRSSLGGFNVLCLYIQDKFGISVGKSQMAIDLAILFTSYFFFEPITLLYSIIGVLALNLVLGMNHKPHRYIVKYK